MMPDSNTPSERTEALEPFLKLSSDLKQAARLLSKSQIRYLVDAYYQAQENRIRADAQVRAAAAGEPNQLLTWNADNHRRFEENYKRALDAFTDEYAATRWAKSIVGIGPVISAGLIAHLDIGKAKTAGHFWAFAGLDPTKKWEKGAKRPWNAELKTLVAFKLGECFVKFQNHKNDTYGKLFRQERDKDEVTNGEGKFAEQTREILAVKKFGADTEALKWYKEGKLPPAHLHARARRWVVKLFLSHLHHVMYVDWHGEEPMKPYAFERLSEDHRHFVPVPNWPWTGGGKSLRELKE